MHQLCYVRFDADVESVDERESPRPPLRGIAAEFEIDESRLKVRTPGELGELTFRDVSAQSLIWSYLGSWVSMSFGNDAYIKRSSIIHRRVSPDRLIVLLTPLWPCDQVIEITVEHQESIELMLSWCSGRSGVEITD